MTIIPSIPKFGDANESVSMLQIQLKKAGFDPGLQDGIFGPKTLKAVREFQKQNNLPGSGLIGPITLQLLDLTVRPMPAGKAAITRDVPGKSGRHLHPTLRLLLEQKVFINGEVPEAFKSKNVTEMVKLTALGFAELGVKEKGGNNRGKEVGLIQAIIGEFKEQGTGDAWCMSLVQCVIGFIEDFLQIESPVPGSEHCMTVLAGARKTKGLVTSLAEPGTMFIGQRGKTQNGHTGLVLSSSSGKMNTFEGNTDDGNMTDGSGAFFRVRDQMVNGNLYIRGFVRLYPFNKIEVD